MASNRHLGRIVALQSLYEYDFREGDQTRLDIAQIVERNLAQYKEVIDDTEFVFDLATNVLARQEEIDAILAPAAPEWPVDQIARIDKVILRVSIYELAIKQEVPPKVVINEAVELGKSFGGDNSSKFINGVLGTVYRERIAKPEEQPEA